VIQIGGMLIVAASVVGGFLMEGGPLMVLFQPVEFLIILGAALGTLIISTPKHHLLGLAAALQAFVQDKGADRGACLDVLKLQYEIFVNARKHGFIALERDIAEPKESSILGKYTSFLARHHAVVFLSDSLRLLVDGAVWPVDLDALLDREIERHHEEASKPVGILAKVGDTLPGLGIVAAVLGIVISMGAIDGPAEIMGHKVAVALVGTFTGVLFAYGFVNPLSAGLELASEKELNYLACIKAGIVAFAKGSPPPVAVEFARRVLFEYVRPTLTETEAAVQGLMPR
jgi:chemotaxis protein MotA